MRRRGPSITDELLATLRRGESRMGAEWPSHPGEPPIILWIDDEPLIAYKHHELTLRDEVTWHSVTSEEEVIDLISEGALPVHRLACIVQDMTRPSGSLGSTVGRYRTKARGIFPLGPPSGDLAFYLRDQFYPMSSLVFFSGVVHNYEVVEAWAKQAPNVFAVPKPARSKDLESLIQCAVDQFAEILRPRPLTEEGRWLLPVAEELAAITAIDHATLEHMSPRQFEEMIAAILTNHGFNTALTQQSRDGGYDLKLLSRRNSNSNVVLVECKKYNPRRCVDVAVVRALYGVKAFHRAEAAYLVTSSYVSPYAKREFETVTPVEMRFFERTDVLDWCKQHFRGLLDPSSSGE